MNIKQLSRDQLAEIKTQYYIWVCGHEDLSYEEIANIDNYVTDEEVFNEYAHCQFVPEDFTN